MKLPIKIFGLVLLLLMVAACNTIEGAGKDIKKAGEAIEEKASD